MFDDDRYFDVLVEYVKADVEDVLIRLTVINRGSETARLRLLPTIWFRNTWSWGSDDPRPSIRAVPGALELSHAAYGKRWLYYEGSPELLFTENETNDKRLFGVENRAACAKDAINEYVVNGTGAAISAERTGTKASAHYTLEIPAGQSMSVRLRLTDVDFSGLRARPPIPYSSICPARKTAAV